MNDLPTEIDPQALQAKWILGGISADEFVQQAAAALGRGFDGTALPQLAGLQVSSRRELGNLPDRAFAEMGLKSMDREEAVTFFAARSELLTSPLILTIMRAFPDFSERWRKHIGEWHGELAGEHIDMSQFVHFVVEDLYEQQKLSEIARAFELLEKLFVGGNQATRDVIGIGFFETLQCFASWRPYGNKVFEPFVGPTSQAGLG